MLGTSLIFSCFQFQRRLSCVMLLTALSINQAFAFTNYVMPATLQQTNLRSENRLTDTEEPATSDISITSAAASDIELDNVPTETFEVFEGQEKVVPYYIWSNCFSKCQSYVISVNDPTGSFTVSINETSGFSSSLEIKPNEGGALDDIVVYIKYKPTNGLTHTATVTHMGPGTASEQFSVDGLVNFPLPIRLLSFNARVHQTNVELKWKAAADSDLSHFDLEASDNPHTNFRKIGSVSYSGKEDEYSFVYNLKSKDVLRYFRLGQVYYNHSTLYSKTVSVKTAAITETKVSVLPNPIITNAQLRVLATEAGSLKVRIHCSNGIEVSNKLYEVLPGENILELNTRSELKAGVYFLIAELNGNISRLKLLKS